MDYLEFAPIQVPQGNAIHLRVGFNLNNPTVQAKKEQIYRKNGKVPCTYFVYPLRYDQGEQCELGNVSFCIVDAYSPLEACLMAMMAMCGNGADAMRRAVKSGDVKLEKTSSQVNGADFVAELVKVDSFYSGKAIFERYSYRKISKPIK